MFEWATVNTVRILTRLVGETMLKILELESKGSGFLDFGRCLASSAADLPGPHFPSFFRVPGSCNRPGCGRCLILLSWNSSLI